VRQAERRVIEEQRRAWERYREQRVRERFAELSQEDQETRRVRFVEQIKGTHTLIYKQFKKDGFDSRLVESQFFSDLHEELLTKPDEVSFEAYQAQHRGTEAGEPGAAA